jgi:hypothetical protein
MIVCEHNRISDSTVHARLLFQVFKESNLDIDLAFSCGPLYIFLKRWVVFVVSILTFTLATFALCLQGALDFVSPIEFR